MSVVLALLHWWEKKQVFGVAVCFPHSGGLLFGDLHPTAFVIQSGAKIKECIIRRAVAPLGGQLDLIFNPQPCILHKTVKILTRNYTIFHFVARLLDWQNPTPHCDFLFSLALIS